MKKQTLKHIINLLSNSLLNTNSSIKLRFLWVRLYIICFGTVLFAQEKTIPSVPDSLKIYQNHKKKSDALVNSSYAILKAEFKKFSHDKNISTLYGEAYIRKAKKMQDTIELANGYDLMFKQNISDYNVALAYIDSIIEFTKNVQHKYYPSRGYLNKGVLLYNAKKYKEALQHYLQAESYAKENNNISHQLAIKHNIGRLKNVLNKHEEALQTYNANLIFLKSNRIENEHEHIYLSTLHGLSDSYNKLENIDSADFYIRKGIKESLKTNNQYFYPDFLLEFGINNTSKQNYTIALDTLYKAEKIMPNSNTLVTKSICHAYIGKNLYQLKKKQEALVYLKKVDSAIHLTNYVPELREAFELLIFHYKKERDNQNQLKLLEKLISLDSISYQNHKSLNIDIVKNYDTNLLIRNRDILINELGIQKKESIKNSQFIIAFICFAAILFFVWYYKRQTGKQMDLQSILNEKQNIIKNHLSKKNTKKDIEIPQELVKELKEKLRAFESREIFLTSDISLVSLSKKLKTNSAYLSKVINTTTNKNFANYINDLRIDYTIKKLQTDQKYRRYSIAAIAKEVGFNNIKPFSRAFFKKTGEHPSTFIKKLE